MLKQLVLVKKPTTSIILKDKNIKILSAKQVVPPSESNKNSDAKAVTDGGEANNSDTRRPTITVQVDVGNEEAQEKGCRPKSCSEPRLSSDERRPGGGKRRGGEKKKTISEETKLKVRDAVFASLLAKQKGFLL